MDPRTKEKDTGIGEIQARVGLQDPRTQAGHRTA
jgi:hypothetical protein